MSFLSKIQTHYQTKVLAEKMPKTVTLTVDSDLNIETEGADVLSDKFGFCVEGFRFKLLSKDSSQQTQTVKFYDIKWDQT